MKEHYSPPFWCIPVTFLHGADLVHLEGGFQAIGLECGCISAAFLDMVLLIKVRRRMVKDKRRTKLTAVRDLEKHLPAEMDRFLGLRLESPESESCHRYLKIVSPQANHLTSLGLSFSQMQEWRELNLMIFTIPFHSKCVIPSTR